MARNKQLTVGELECYLSLIKNKDIKVCIGIGEGEYPLRFLLNSHGDLLLHTSAANENWQCGYQRQGR